MSIKNFFNTAAQKADGAFAKKIAISFALAAATMLSGCASMGDFRTSGTLAAAAIGGLTGYKLSGGDRGVAAVSAVVTGAVANDAFEKYEDPCVTRTSGRVRERTYNGQSSREQDSETLTDCKYRGSTPGYQQSVPVYERRQDPGRYYQPQYRPNVHYKR